MLIVENGDSKNELTLNINSARVAKATTSSEMSGYPTSPSFLMGGL